MKKFIKQNILIILICSAFLVIEVILIAVTPLWQNHDEVKHFAYTYYLVEQKKLPPLRSDFINEWDIVVPEEIKTADTLFENDKIFRGIIVDKQLLHQDFTQAGNWQEKVKSLSSLNRTISAQEYKNNTSTYPPLYYLLEAIPYYIWRHESIITRAFMMRLFSSLMILVALIFIYRTALLFFKNKLLAATAAALVGFIPAFSYVYAGINNDALLTMLTTILVYLLLKFAQKPLTIRQSLLIGLIFGAGLITKPQFTVFALPLVGWFIYKIWREKFNKKVISCLIVTLLAALVIATPWYLYKYTYSQNLSTAISLGVLLPGQGSYFWLLNFFYFYKLVLFRYFFIYSSYFFAAGCCHEVVAPPIVQLFIGLFTGLAMAGIIYYLARAAFKKENRRSFMAFCFFAAFPIVLEASLLSLFLRQSLSSGMPSFPIDGRYFFPVAGPLIILFLIGTTSLIPQKWHRLMCVVLISGLLISAIISLFYTVIPRFYL